MEMSNIRRSAAQGCPKLFSDESHSITSAISIYEPCSYERPKLLSSTVYLHPELHSRHLYSVETGIYVRALDFEARADVVGRTLFSLISRSSYRQLVILDASIA